MSKTKYHHLRIYDFLRQFHKNELFEIMDNYEKELKKDSFKWDALETLSGTLYLLESIFARED